MTDQTNACVSCLTAILPAHNEAGRVGHVLAVLREVSLLAAILVVDDGSTDSTLAEVQAAAVLDPRILPLRNPQNLGKGQSIFEAWRWVTTPYFLMLDSDLIGLTPQHVRDLVQPVLDGRTDMTLGIFKGGFIATNFAHWATPWLSGQRCLRTDKFASVDEESSGGYGLEAALTVAARRNHWRTMKIPLRGVYHPPSELHRGLIRGFFNRAKMYAQIIRAFILAEVKR